MPPEPIKHRFYRIKISLVEKKIKFCKTNWSEGPRDFLSVFRIPGITKREKTCFQEKNVRDFSINIIKNVQNGVKTNFTLNLNKLLIISLVLELFLTRESSSPSPCPRCLW